MKCISLLLQGIQLLRTVTMPLRPIATTFDKRSLLLFSAITIGAAGASWAQSTTATVKNDQALVALFAQADKDGNKMLSKEESKAIPALNERFVQVDSNGDAMVSESEFMASMAPAAK